MSIMIVCEDKLSNYIVETKVNGSIIRKADIEFNDINSNVVRLDISLKFENKAFKENFLNKILFYLFGFIYIYFISLDEFLESNEYLVQLVVNNFKENSNLNILLKKEDSRLINEVTNNNCNIIKNLTETKINQNIYNQKLKRYKKMRFIAAMIILLFPTYFLIMSLIYKMYDMTLVVSVLELILIFMLIILSKKIRKK